MRPAKKTNACIPCHERKVRCDAFISGTPCSRCVSKARVQHCVLVTRKTRRAANQELRVNSQYHNNDPGLYHTHGWPQERVESPSNSRTASSRQEILDSTPYTVSEEDAQIQTLHRMADDSSPTNLSGNNSGQPTATARHHIEYLDRLNSVSILCEALGHRQPKRLIQVELPGPNYMSAKEREIVDLGPNDIAYLESKRVFDPPPKETCIVLLRLYFECIHPYCPVLDRIKFYQDFIRGSLSHLLLFAILANVVPYSSLEDLEQAGYDSKINAQHDFYLKAQLLHDFGCERSQLTILQASIVLSTFHYHFAPAKDHRFWFPNAVRLATQLGLHRQKLGNDLDPATHKLCRRIWWLLYTRDVLFSLSGFGNMRAINDEESDTLPLSETDWDDELVSIEAGAMLPPVTALQRHFFVQNCKLATLGAKFLRHSRTLSCRWSSSTITTYAEEIRTWRRQLPEDLSQSRVQSWSQENVWIIVLLALSYRLECVFYRQAREVMLQDGDESTVSWCRQQLWGCVFELDTWMNRAIMHDLIQYCPSSLIVCACNLLAFHIEIALDPIASHPQKLTAKTRIHAMLAYLQEISSSWRMAKWTYRVSEWVVRRAGLMLKDENGPREEMRKRHQEQQQQQHRSAHPRIEAARSEDATNLLQFDAAAFDIDQALPEQWVQDFLGESFFGQLDDELLPTYLV